MPSISRNSVFACQRIDADILNHCDICHSQRLQALVTADTDQQRLIDADILQIFLFQKFLCVLGSVCTYLLLEDSLVDKLRKVVDRKIDADVKTHESNSD